jgi:hypothetical protein
MIEFTKDTGWMFTEETCSLTNGQRTLSFKKIHHMGSVYYRIFDTLQAPMYKSEKQLLSILVELFTKYAWDVLDEINLTIKEFYL